MITNESYIVKCYHFVTTKSVTTYGKVLLLFISIHIYLYSAFYNIHSFKAALKT